MPSSAACAPCDCDLVVIGAGPAGLSTAVYAGAEECRVRLLDAGDKPGGQAGSSTQIRNYFGFPDGVSGPELAALGVDGAISFGVDLRAPVSVHSVERNESGVFDILTVDEAFTAKSVVIATGATPRRHRASGVAAYLGRGVSYRGPSEADHISAYNVGLDPAIAYVVGGGNSAGQAATFLAREGCDVHIIVRGSGLAASMSRYLISEIDSAPNIELHTHTTLESVRGDRRMKTLGLLAQGKPAHVDADYLYLLLGSDPNTAWLRGSLALDDKGFVMTGSDVSGIRDAMPHETNIAGIFAAGDVRAGSLKRVAAAVGEGAGAYFDVHRYLND